MSTTTIVSNVVLFQIGWFAGVLSAAAHRPWFGLLVTTAVVFTHVFRAPMPRPELELVLFSLGLGLAFDSLLVWQGWLEYSSGIVFSNHLTGKSPLAWTDFTPVSLLFNDATVLAVKADSPLRSSRDLVDRLRRDPYASSFAVGSTLGSSVARDSKRERCWR